jgi:hypothetical protein
MTQAHTIMTVGASHQDGLSTVMTGWAVMEWSFAIEQAYYCLYVCLHLLYLCVATEWVWLWNSI